jgi:hypothetical protein
VTAMPRFRPGTRRERELGAVSVSLSTVFDWKHALTQNPSAWQASEHAPDVRRFVMKPFPFTIVDTELAEEILIVAVAHSSRRRRLRRSGPM